MALDKATLITSLKAAFVAGVGRDDDALQISTDIANAIDTYIKGSLSAATAGGAAVTPGKTVVA